MFSFDGSVTGDLLNIKLPTSADWLKLGLDEAKEIRQRTETKGLDVKGESFKPYSAAYAAYRAEMGRGTMPNLSFSGRMLGALGSNVSATGDSARLTLAGEEGFKAWSNERRGREFMGVTPDRLQLLAEQFASLVIKGIT